MTRVLALVLALMGGPLTAQALTNGGVLGLLDDCADAIVTGEVAGFEGFAVETDVTTETAVIRGFRGQTHPGLVVSLIRRGGLGMCDVALVPGTEAEIEALPGVAQEARAHWGALRADPSNRADPNAMGGAVMTCRGSQGLSIWIDAANLDNGFNAQVALVGPAKMECGG